MYRCSDSRPLQYNSHLLWHAGNSRQSIWAGSACFLHSELWRNGSGCHIWSSDCPHHKNNSGVPRCVASTCVCFLLQKPAAVCDTRCRTFENFIYCEMQILYWLTRIHPFYFGGAGFISQPRKQPDIYHGSHLSLQTDSRIVSCGLSYRWHCKINHKETLILQNAAERLWSFSFSLHFEEFEFY